MPGACSAASRVAEGARVLGGWEFIRWLVSGGESDRDARPSHPDWHRAARDFCAAHGIAYFFKQWGEWGYFARDLAIGEASEDWHWGAGDERLPFASCRVGKPGR